MLLLRALLLEGLISFHIIGAALLFRRLFPRENPWLALLLPPLFLVIVLNFVEHFVALPNLGWLLPILMAGLVYNFFTMPVGLAADLKLPGSIFLIAYGFVLGVKSLHPTISNISEGVADMTRILDFTFGDTLPPTDSWLPPYSHAWYYTFQHYGASVLKRLFVLDIGTAYNFSFALFCAWVALAGCGAAYYAGQGRAWVAWVTLFLIEAAFTGSSPLIALFAKGEPNVWIACNLTMDWDKPERNPLSWLLRLDPHHETLKLFPPGAWTWFDEFHPTFGGHYLTLMAALATQVIFLPRRTNWAWICLAILPVLTVITATWYLLIVSFLCAGGLFLAWWAGRRPEDGRWVFCGIAGVIALLWPTLGAFTTWPHDQGLGWNHAEWHTPLWTFVIQWWPIFLPWLLLCFAWPRLELPARWLHAAVAVLFIGVEMLNVGPWRLDTVEKMWGAIYGLGLVTVVPLLLVQAGWAFRLVAGILFVAAFVSLVAWGRNTLEWVDWKRGFLHFEGDSYLTNDDRKKRMLQILQRYHRATVLAGKCDWAYTEPPGLVGFSENRCYVGWSFAEDICGHAGEAEYRSGLNNDFYAGKLSAPLRFLRDNGLSAVLIWPGDHIPDSVMQRLRNQLDRDYEYIDCRGDGAENSGVFVRRGSDVSVTPFPISTMGATNAPAVSSP